ncbi:MAG: hypothetical protein ABFR75_10285 [Acidobacteriota bacterium]
MRSKILIFVLSLILVSAFTFSADNFEKGGKYLTPQIGLNSYAIPFGASFGVGITDNIEVGGTLMLQFWGDIGFSFTVIQPSLDAFYHFTSLDLPVDLFAGASLGYSVFSSDNDYFGVFASSLYLSPMVGARYFIKDKLAISLKLYFSILGELGGVGTVLGATLVL